MKHSGYYVSVFSSGITARAFFGRTLSLVSYSARIVRSWAGHPTKPLVIGHHPLCGLYERFAGRFEFTKFYLIVTKA